MQAFESLARIGRRSQHDALGSAFRYAHSIRGWRAAGRGSAGARSGLEPLEPRQLLSAHPLVTEGMAVNDDDVGLGQVERDFGKPDPLGDGSMPDWSELLNAGDKALGCNKWGSWDQANGSRAHAARGEAMREHIGPHRLAGWSFRASVRTSGNRRALFGLRQWLR